jgi:serine/threonine-protein kinase
VVLFEMLTGTKPFRAEEAVDVLRMHREVPPPRLADVAADTPLSDEIEGALQQALAKDASNRFASAAAFATALDHVPEAASRPGSAPPMAPAAHRTPAPELASATAVMPAPPARPSIDSPMARQDTALGDSAMQPASAAVPAPPAARPSIESPMARQDTALPAGAAQT